MIFNEKNNIFISNNINKRIIMIVLSPFFITNSNKTDILSQCRTGTDWACFWASLPDQAEKKILKIKDFIKDFT